VNNYNDLEWISGLSAGDNKYYQFTEVSNDPELTSYHVCDLTASAPPEEFDLNHYGIIEGKPENVYDNLGIKVRATDENNITTSKEVFISTEGSFLMVDSVMVSSGGDDVIEYGETADLTVTVKCLGNEPITGATMKILIDDQYINILDNTEILGNFTPGEIKTFINAFSFEVSNSVPNNYEITFLAPINDNSGNEWENNILLTAYAPEIYMGNVSINDGNNGYIDPGENCDLVIDLFNYGGSTAYNIVSTLSSTDPYVTINNNTGYLPSLSPYEPGANATFNITVSSDVLIGHSLDFSLDISADLGISSTHIFSLVVGHPSILIIDLDPNNNSAPLMETSFDVLGVSYDITTLFPPNLNTYSGIFVCLGIYNDNHVLTSGEGQLLADYLDTGGNLYMEGGDTWYFDSQTAVHSMFNINGESDGTSDLSIINGQSGTFTDGMSFSYGGENSWIDHISPISPAMLILENQSPVYGTGVAYDAGTYKTIGASHEFGGLTDGVLPSTKEELMRKYLEFFDLLPPPVYSLDLKVYLEGPFSTTGMNTDLNTNNLLPFQQPYNIYPWYYNGTENVSVIPNADIVDWVLIELRDTTAVELASSESMITRQVAFLLKDGSIVRMDGTSRLQFNNLIEHQLYVVAWQRNHLGVLSANALTGINDIYYYDFTSYENRVYGGNLGHKEISPGIWGLISGDGNCDGQINMLDLSTIWSMQAGQSTYELGDFNMDGNIDNKDKNDIFILNEGYSSQVPD
jgi:regulation of enolase protein 1 (concanavalin A-like superfamily)